MWIIEVPDKYHNAMKFNIIKSINHQAMRPRRKPVRLKDRQRHGYGRAGFVSISPYPYSREPDSSAFFHALADRPKSKFNFFLYLNYDLATNQVCAFEVFLPPNFKL